VRWLRAALLVFDQIQVIRPKDVTNPDYYPGNQSIFDRLPEVFSEIQRTHYEMTLAPSNQGLVVKTFEEIAERTNPNPDELTLEIHTEGDVSVPGYTLLHVSKLPPFVNEVLEQLKLVHIAAEKVVRNLNNNFQDFRVVQTDAANVILALIADHYGRTERLRTISDETLAYLNVAFNQNPARQRTIAAMHLASAILRLQIPAEIAQLSPEEYVSLRKRYADLREPFQHAIQTICDDNLLSEIESPPQFEEAVREASREFSRGVDSLLTSSFSNTISRWVPLSFGILSSLCRLAQPVTAIIGVGVDCLLKIYAGLAEKVPPTEIQSAQRLMATLQHELASPILMRRIVV
jgi:hypothetical protein